MMVTKEALLPSILHSPADDLARLAYADWLDEHGDEQGRARAELIRTQTTLRSTSYSDPQWGVLHRRETKLVAQYGSDWASPIPGVGVHEVRFDRGFVKYVRATAHAFLSRGASWAASHPLETLRLTRVAGRGRRLADSPLLSRIASLTLEDPELGDDDLLELSRSRHLPELPSLSITGNKISTAPTRVTARGLRHLVGSQVFPNLSSLSVNLHTTEGSGGVEALAEIQHAGLEKLYLTGGRIDDRDAVALASAPALSALHTLALRASQVGDSGLLALLRSPHLSGLRELVMDQNRITGPALTSLAGTAISETLESLTLRHNPIQDVDIDATETILGAHPNLTVNLIGCPILLAVRLELIRRLGDRVLVDKPCPRRRRTSIS